jgi:hypothetical protein
MAKVDKASVVIDEETPDAPAEANGTPKNLDPSTENVDTGQAIVKQADVVNLFDASTLAEPAALPLAADMPERKVENRGRKKKYATPEEAAAAEAERKRQWRINKQKGGTQPEDANKLLGQIAVNPMSATAKLGARTVVFSLDTFKAVISNRECPVDEQGRAQLIAVWEQYLLETGKQPPAWIMVTILSCAYVVPAFDTPTAKSRLSGMIAYIRGWWAKKFGG